MRNESGPECAVFSGHSGTVFCTAVSFTTPPHIKHTGIFFNVAKMNAPVYVRALEPKFTPSFPSTREPARCPQTASRLASTSEYVEVGFFEKEKKKKKKDRVSRARMYKIFGLYLEGVEGADNKQEAQY